MPKTLGENFPLVFQKVSALISRQVGALGFPNVSIASMIATVRAVHAGVAEDVAARFFPTCPAVVAINPPPTANGTTRHNKALDINAHLCGVFS
jgi:hypothetical protein